MKSPARTARSAAITFAVASLVLPAFGAPAEAQYATSKRKKGSYTRWPLPAAGESKSGDPEIILTFDDGPHERYTAVVLDELAKRNMKAIFFWVGRRVTKQSPHLARRRALVERAIREGHIVANHGVDHVHLCKVSAKRARAELVESVEVYRELTGLPIVFFRTPYGDHCKRLVRMLDELGLRHLHWDIDPMEWTDNNFRRVAGTLRRKMKRLDGRAVMLMHDTRQATAKALPLALEWLDAENQRRRARGGRPIRVLTGSDLAFESLDQALVGWLRDTGHAAEHRVGAALTSLIP